MLCMHVCICGCTCSVSQEICDVTLYADPQGNVIDIQGKDQPHVYQIITLLVGENTNRFMTKFWRQTLKFNHLFPCTPLLMWNWKFFWKGVSIFELSKIGRFSVESGDSKGGTGTSVNLECFIRTFHDADLLVTILIGVWFWLPGEVGDLVHYC